MASFLPRIFSRPSVSSGTKPASIHNPNPIKIILFSDILFSLNESDLATSISDGTKNEVIQKLMVLEKPITISTSELVEYQEDFSDYYIRSWNLTRDTLLQNLTNLLSDREWIHPMSVYVRNQLNAQKQRRKPIFLYYFTKESNSSYASSYKERWGEPTVPFGKSDIIRMKIV